MPSFGPAPSSKGPWSRVWSGALDRMAAGRGWILFTILAATPPPPSPSPSPSPSASPPARPVSDAVDRVVNRMEDAREDPCKKAGQEGKPCFPVTTTVRGEEYSVRKSLGLPDLQKGKTAPGGAPTVAEMTPYRPGAMAGALPLPIPLVKFDPGCLAKGLLKSLKGKNDTYYLYRVRDIHGERVALYDRRLNAENFQGELAFLGKFEGECDALAAFRHEELMHPPSGAPGPRPWPSPSATPSPR